MEEQRKTVQDLEQLITRCFKELEESKDIKKEKIYDDPKVTDTRTVIVNEENVARHISMTIIGELQELEVVRKLAPWFRQMRSLERDMEYIEMRQAAATSLLGLRIEAPTSKPPENR